MKLRDTLCVLVIAASSCGPSDSSISSSPSQARNTSDYLWEAIDSDLFFRWTEPAGYSKTWVFFWVDDVNVPSGFQREQAVRDFERARDAWKTAIRDGGEQIESTTRWASKDSPFSESSAVVEVSYVDSLPDRLGEAGISRYNAAGEVYGGVFVMALRSFQNGTLLEPAESGRVALHEMGHSLGIQAFSGGGSHSQHYGDIMAPDGAPWLSLSVGDSRAIQTLYRSWPNLIRIDS